MTPSLKQTEELFQDCLLAGDDDDAILALVGTGTHEKSAILLGVYKNAYRIRLGEVLATDYPRLHAYLGDEQFRSMAMTYLDRYPSRLRSARWFGDSLPTFLAAELPWNGRQEVHDIAALDKTLNAVFDAADESPLTLDAFAAIDGEDWPSLEFAPINALYRLTQHSNAAEIWTALKDEREPPAARTIEPVPFLVYRQDYQSRFRQLGSEEAMMWDEMTKGAPFGTLCELVATFGGEEHAAERAASYLGSWIASGLLLPRR